jgi:hypothetical protein
VQFLSKIMIASSFSFFFFFLDFLIRSALLLHCREKQVNLYGQVSFEFQV